MDGTRVIRAILKEAPRLLKRREGGKVWMEVDASHPALFAAEEGEKIQRNVKGGMRLVEWRRDLSGRPRFCCWAWMGEEDGGEGEGGAKRK
jgi:methylase of polypeptide subunit release factors